MVIIRQLPCKTYYFSSETFLSLVLFVEMMEEEVEASGILIDTTENCLENEMRHNHLPDSADWKIVLHEKMSLSSSMRHYLLHNL